MNSLFHYTPCQVNTLLTRNIIVIIQLQGHCVDMWYAISGLL